MAAALPSSGATRSGCTTRAESLGRRPDARPSRSPRAPRRSAPRSSAPAHPVVAADAAARRRALAAVHDRALLDFLAGAWDEWDAAGLIRAIPARTASCRTSSPTPGCSATLDAGAPGRDLGAHRPLRVRHDDADRARAPGRRRAARSTPRSPPPTSCSPARPPRTPAAARPATTSRAPRTAARCYLNNARDRRRAAARGARRPGRAARRRRPPRQRRAGDLLRPRRRADGLGPRRPRRRLVPALPRLRRRGRDRRGRGREPQRRRSRPGRGDDAWVASRRRARGWARGGGAARAGRRARRRRRRGRPREPAAGHRRRASARPAARSARSGCRRSSCRRAATTSRRSARLVRGALDAASQEGTRRVALSRAARASGSGKDEHEGIPVQPRKDVGAAAALAARGDRRDRAAALAPRRAPTAGTPSSSRTATRPTSGCSTSRTGRVPRAADHRPRADAVLGGHRAAALARRRDGRVRRRRPGLARAGGRRAAAQAARGRRPGLDRRRDAARRDRARATRRGSRSSDVDDPWPRRLAARPRRPRCARRRVGRRPSPPTAPRSRTSSPRAPTSTAREIRVVDVATGAVRALTGTPGCRTARRPGRPTARRSPTSPSAPAAGSCTWSAATARRPAAHAATTPTSASPPGTPTATASPRSAAVRNRFGLVAGRRRRPGGRAESPRAARGARRAWTADGDVVGAYEDHATPPELRRIARRGEAHAHAARARPARGPRAPHVSARGGLVPLARRARDPRLPVPPGERVGRRARRRRSSIPTAARPTPTSTTGTATRSTSSTRATPGSRVELPRLDRLRPRLRAREPRRLGRRRHVGLPRGGRLPAHARLGRRRPARDLRRQLRLLHGAARGDRRPRAPLPLRRGEVRRLRHRHVVGAGRPRGRPGPRADDGPRRRRRARPTAPARPSTASRTSRRRC